jgi:hypothetical protein
MRKLCFAVIVLLMAAAANAGTAGFFAVNFYWAGFISGNVIQPVAEVPACWQCPGQPYGDTNGDGKVNAIDYFNFRKWYWGACAPPPCYNCCCDFNHDGKLNAMDFFILKKNYGKTGLGTCSDTSC